MTKLTTKILFIDDEESLREVIRHLLEAKGYQITLAADGKSAREQIASGKYDIAFVDYYLPDENGLQLLQVIKSTSPTTDVVIMTGFASIEMAVEAMRLGAYDYIAKPFEPEKLLSVLEKISEKQRQADEEIPSRLEITTNGRTDVILSQSNRMREIFHLINKVAPSDTTVLVLGESGTGKELIARAIHARSLRKNKPFLAMDCGSLVETLFESELFGHVKGSFTGAIETKHGSFELAHTGTFFFDEIGNISLNMQAKILRAIQEKEIRRVGSNEFIKVDVRVIAATNMDLRKAVANGIFREDLYYRLSVIPIHLPPLRERKEDILLLAEYFLKKYNEKRSRQIKSFTEEVRNVLKMYPWPGNVRELENVIERSVLIEDSENITKSSLPAHIIGSFKNSESQDIRSLEEVERDYIQKALTTTQHNISRTARLLGIDRKTLYEKIRRYGLETDK